MENERRKEVSLYLCVYAVQLLFSEIWIWKKKKKICVNLNMTSIQTGHVGKWLYKKIHGTGDLGFWVISRVTLQTTNHYPIFIHSFDHLKDFTACLGLSKLECCHGNTLQEELQGYMCLFLLIGFNHTHMECTLSNFWQGCVCVSVDWALGIFLLKTEGKPT